MDALWCREFSGFFWGEGNFMIDIYIRQRQRTKTLADGSVRDYGIMPYTMIRVRARIIQRQDSRAVLEHLVSVLGGHIYVHKSRKMVSGGNGKTYTNQQQLVWQIQDRDQVAKVLDILDQSEFPTMKRREVAIMRQCIDILRSHGKNWLAEDIERVQALKNELTRLRIYSSC